MDRNPPEISIVPHRETTASVGHYANFFKVGYTSCEFLLEFGQLFPEVGSTAPVLHTRIISSPPYVKALIDTLDRTIKQFESEYGSIRDLADES